MKRCVFLFALALLATYALVGCGGGGGGGGSSSSSPYTGTTTAAVITPSNAQAISLGAFQGGDAGASLVGPLGPSTNGNFPEVVTARPMYLDIVQTLKKANEQAWSQESPSGEVAPRAIVTESGTISDGLGGGISYTLSVDDQTGSFKGSFSFSNYHGDAGAIISGSVNVSGTYNINSSTITQISFSSISLAVTDGSSSLTATGSFVLYNGNPASATLNLYLRNNTTGKTTWIDNFTINVTEGAGYADVTASGKIYLHDYGYVVISTSTPFRYSTGNTYPSSGVMICTGSSNGRVRLTADSSTSYTVSVDANGDGTYETSTSYTWI